jgi:hypothetical protein
VSLYERGERAVGERVAASERFVRHYAEGVDVAGLTHRIPSDLLGRHIRGAPAKPDRLAPTGRAPSRSRSPRCMRCRPRPTERSRASRRGRRYLPKRCRERLGHPARGSGVVRREWPDPRPETASAKEPHDEVPAVRITPKSWGDDVWMLSWYAWLPGKWSPTYRLTNLPPGLSAAPPRGMRTPQRDAM